MPLSAPSKRKEIHHRVIDMHAYARDDGLFDVEARLIDQKPFDTIRFATGEKVPAGRARHDLWVRLTVDAQFVVRAVEASSDVTPYPVCKEAEASLAVMIGVPIASGWSTRVKERLRGSASCTHLMEMLIPLATTTLQGMGGLDPTKNSALNSHGVPRKLDTCHAYGRSSEVVKLMWPDHYRPR